MTLQMAVVAVNGDEELRPQQVDHQPQFLLRAVSAYVDQTLGAIVVDDLGVASFQVVDHAVDRLLVARNHARAKHYRVAGFDTGEFVVVYGGARQDRKSTRLNSSHLGTSY